MAVFTFTNNVPQASQTRSATQAPIQANFQAFNEFINVNHYGFGTNNAGKHTYTSLPFQNSDPTTASGEMAVYAKATSGGPNTGEIFYRYPSNGTIVQLTGSTTDAAGIATNGWAILSGQSSTTYPIMLQWGQQSGITQSFSGQFIPFVTGSSVPSYNTTYQSIFTTFIGNSAAIVNFNANCTQGGSSTGFYLRVPGTGTPSGTLYWMAIGPCVLP